MTPPRLALVTGALFLLAVFLHIPARAQTPAAAPVRPPAPVVAELRRLEGMLRASAGGTERSKAVQAYRAALARAGDLAAHLPLNALESELVRVVGIEKSMRAGPYGHLVGHHVVLAAPARWLESVGPDRAEAMATLDAGFVLLEDLTGCDLARARGRRLLIVFTPDHPPASAQTLEAVVWAGLDHLTVPLPYQMLFHEMGHELFPPFNLRPRRDTFNEMWPELGREYVSWWLGMRTEAEAARASYLAAYQNVFLGRGLPLEQLGPYQIGAGMLQTVVDAALRRDDDYDWEPLRRFFRSVLPLPETDSFFQKQETLAFQLGQTLGPRVLPALEQAGFVLRKERRGLLAAELATAAPLFAATRHALERDDEAGATKIAARLGQEFPGSPWTNGARTALAGWCTARGRNVDALAWLKRAGHVVKWQVLGPFLNPGGANTRTAFPPEAKIDLQAGCAIDGGTLRWQAVAPTGNGYVNLDTLFPGGDTALAYAFCELTSDRARGAVLWTASDDTLAAWVNGEEALRRELPRGCWPDTERTPVRLRAGRNTLLLKIGDLHRGGWGFTCRVTDESDVPLPGN